MSGRLRVVIATTDGPSTVRRITPEDPELRSVVCLAGTATALAVSRDYDAFVRRPTGIVERDVGHPVFRVDLDRPIDEGRSWQLGLYIAHRLKAEGRLAEDDQPADGTVWATGTVDADLVIGAVERVADKARRSTELFAAQAPVLAVVQDANADGLPDGVERLTVSRMAEVLEHLHLVESGKRAAPSVFRPARLAVAAALVAVAGGALWSMSQPQDVRNDAPAIAAPAPESVPAPPPFDPMDVTFEVSEARAIGQDCGAATVVDPTVESEPGVCAVAFQATNGGARPARMWLYGAVQGTFREYASRKRYVELADGMLQPGQTGVVTVHPPSWVRRPVIVRGVLILAEGEHPQVDRAMVFIDLQSSSGIDAMIGGLRDLGVSVRELYHRVVPAR